ncbi:hypothetical protein [Anabaena azotica]|uniref:Uncharacterized protein n=1 Tax=Anabaena azotica FACHB-119 TaxID=947527 RepID=A0ABR8D8E8_9NOST|nr:hypothetical protein [Anabaena azotica]MBD2502401.1 hypothetical protein [Anabaena azotica FACHB-119]
MPLGSFSDYNGGVVVTLQGTTATAFVPSLIIIVGSSQGGIPILLQPDASSTQR